MTHQEIIELATKVYGECDWHESALHHLEAFSKLVDAKATAREREACAIACETDGRDLAGLYYAGVIRARGGEA
jgi:hypothetical protein